MRVLPLEIASKFLSAIRCYSGVTPSTESRESARPEGFEPPTLRSEVTSRSKLRRPQTIFRNKNQGKGHKRGALSSRGSAWFGTDLAPIGRRLCVDTRHAGVVVSIHRVPHTAGIGREGIALQRFDCRRPANNGVAAALDDACLVRRAVPVPGRGQAYPALLANGRQVHPNVCETRLGCPAIDQASRGW